MKSTTELCLRKFRVRRSLQKNETKNKKGNDKKKKEKKRRRKKLRERKMSKEGKRILPKGKRIRT